MQIRIGKLSRFDFEAIVLIATPQALQHISGNRQGPRLPLFEHVAILVQHEPGILEKIGRTAAQIDTAVARGGDGAPVQTRHQRVFDHSHVLDAFAEQELERSGYRLRNRH